MVESIAYHPGTGSLYFIKYYENNAGEFCTGLYALDPANAKETRVGSLDTTYDYSGLAYSQKDGCFYIIGYLYGYDQENGGFQCPTKLYRFSLPEDGETITLEEASDFGVWNTTGGELMLDEKNNVAYIFRSGSQSAEILTYDFDTNTLAVTGQTDPYTAICLPDDSTANHNGIVRTVPTSIDMNVTAMNLFVDETKGLSAEVGPWCLDNKRVTWTSSNPDVATVDADGKVTGVAKGTATIVAASVLDNTLTATCVVSVIGNDFTFHGVGSTADGKSQLFTYDSTSGTVSGQAHVTDMNGTVIPVESAMLTGDGAVWVQDNVVDNQGLGYRLHSIDTATGQSTFDSDANTNKEKETSLLFCDLVYDSWNHISLGVNGSDNLYMSKGDISPNQIGNIIFADLKGSFTAVTVGETWTGTYSKYTRVYLLDIQKNRICIADVSYDTYWGAWSVTMQHCPIQADLLYEADRQGQYQDSLVYDTATGTPILFHYTKAGTEIYALTLDQTIASFNAIRLGSLDTYQNVAAYSAAFHGDAATVEVPVPVQGERHLAHATEEDISMGTTNLAADTPQKDSNGVISINLLAEESAASGMVEIRLGHHITLVSVESSAQLSSYQESNGNVIFAYAGSEAIAEGDIVAVLRLKDIIEPAAVTVIENERSGQIPDATPTVIEFGHAWGEWTVIQEATCTANGQEIRTCSICHETETREIEANNNHCPSQNFTDLDTSSWYHESVDYVLRKGWIIGIGNTKFAPHAEITRGMIITILYRLAGEPEINGSSPFNDVVEGRYYTNAVIWAYENQIAAGMTSELFAPNTPATREQLVTFLYRYAQSAGFKASAQGSLNAFPDGDIVSGFAKEAVTWAVASGLLQGDTNGRLLPRATATRAQAAEVLYRYATVIA